MLRNKFILSFLIYSLLLSSVAFGQYRKVEIYQAPKDVLEKIKAEGMGDNSKVMETASYLTDVIGGRLTNSPNMMRANIWTRDTMKQWGMHNAEIEAWGEFGRGWSLKEFSAQIVEPQGFPVIAYPKAWSPSTNGEVTGEVVHIQIRSEEDLAQYKGKLKNAIVLMSNMKPLKPNFEAMATRWTDEQLLVMANARNPEFAPPPRVMPAQQVQDFIIKPAVLATKTLNFLIEEGAAAMVDVSSKGSGGTLFVMDATVGGEPPPGISSPGSRVSEILCN